MSDRTDGVDAALAGLDRSTWPYWQAAAEGRLTIQACGACGERYFYPRPFCPFCASRDVRWLECSGRGHVYTYTVVPRATPSPSVIAYVTLEEGPTVLTRLVTDDPYADHIGRAVTASFATADGTRPILLFAAAR